MAAWPQGRDLRVGIVGLGGAAALVMPWFARVDGVRLSGGADPRAEARAAFEVQSGAPSFDTVEALCRSEGIDAVWIETPSHLHCEHALIAAAHGKHIICAKPLATTIAECDAMIAAADAAGVLLLQGHSKIFDAPIQAMRAVIASGRLGRAVQVQTSLYNDWLRRPRLPEELDEAKGGGVILRQGPHLVDIATYLCGGGARSVRAVTGSWDPNFEAPGNFTALLDFGAHVAASLTFDGYGYFDSTELHWNIGAMGAQRAEPAPATPRRRATLTPEQKYGAAPNATAVARRASGEHPPFFGLTIVSCERGVLRQSPDGLFCYSEHGREELPVPGSIGRGAELIELRDALREGRGVFPDGRWARATLETCLAIAESGRTGDVIPLEHQATASQAFVTREG